MPVFCAECGRPLDEGARFCGECGAAVAAAPAPAQAPAMPTLSAAQPAPGAPAPRGPARWILVCLVLIGALAAASIVLREPISRAIRNLRVRVESLRPGDPSPGPSARPTPVPRSQPPAPPVVAPPTISVPPPGTPAPGVPQLPPRIAVEDLQLTSVTSSATAQGTRVTLRGRFVLSGASGGVSIRVVPAWRVAALPLEYAEGTTITASSGRVAITGTMRLPVFMGNPGPAQVHLAVRIGGVEYLTPPRTVATQSADVPTPVAPRTEQPGGATPPPPPAATPPLIVVTPEPPRAAPAVTNVRLTATTAAQVAPGDTVRFTLSFWMRTSTRTTIEPTLGWREPSGELRFGSFGSREVDPGPHEIRGMWFRVGTAVAPGTTFPIYGVVRAGGQIYRSQVPVVVTVVSR